jgi:hypothetical protein
VHTKQDLMARTALPTKLSALTTAALVLPGLISPTAAEGDEVDFQYSHYQEDKRDVTFGGFDLAGNPTVVPGKSFNPIEVDSVHGHGNFTLTDRIKFAFNYTQDTWGGATPISTAPSAFGGNQQISDSKDPTIRVGASPLIKNGAIAFDRNLNVYTGKFDPDSGLVVYNPETRTTHILSTASPETRKQGDFKLSYEWDEAAISVGGGISVEDDFESRFGNIGGRLDFNNKQTTVNLDLSYTNSETKAVIDHDAQPYIAKDHYYWDQVNNAIADAIGGISRARTINGLKQDWGVHAGITQVLNKSALVSGDFIYTRSTGYMANPYKLTQFFFVDPAQFEFSDFVEVYESQAFLERRPEVRNQWGVGGRYIQYVEPLAAALHFDYRFNADDWGIHSHTFEADWVQPLNYGWTVTPRIRYYSQDAADFYTPFGVLPEALQTQERVVNGRVISAISNKLPSAFSSDHRLSGYGALSGGVTVSKQFAKGLTLETGFEYYSHQGSLKIGGGGEGAFADFDYWVANAALKVDLNAVSLNIEGGGHGGHHGHHVHGAHAPAGVMFDHMLAKTGDWMVGYRYMYSSQGGAMLQGENAVNDLAIVNNGCPEPGEGLGCFVKPSNMAMHMHMLDLMYAPTDWLTLMLMPQFVDMSMTMRPLEGARNSSEINDLTGFPLNQHLSHHVQNSHETGGIGDLGIYTLVKLFDDGVHHLHVTAGFSAPTGDVDIKLRRNHQIDGGFIHYGMQLGSGTWDFKPSVTYTGHSDQFSWGAQASGTVRMEDANKSGYRLGDIFQATAWGGYQLTNWLSASVRGLYTLQGAIHGAFASSQGQFVNPVVNSDGTRTLSSSLKFGPMDYPGSYGGRFWDIGFGLSAIVPSGDLAGNRISVEWLHPVEDDVNGYQLDRDGTLSATWSLAF